MLLQKVKQFIIVIYLLSLEIHDSQPNMTNKIMAESNVLPLN